MDFGRKLQELRRGVKHTQTAVAEELGVTKQTVANWERNRRQPSIKVIKKLSKLLGVTPGDILEWKAEYELERKRRQLDKDFKKQVVRKTKHYLETQASEEIPILDPSSRLNPREAIAQNKEGKWAGRSYYLSSELSPDETFGFEVKDETMEPIYHQGDVLIATINPSNPLQNNTPVVAKARGAPPTCRIYSGEGGVKILRAMNPKTPIKIARGLEWCFPVIGVRYVRR